MNFELSEFDNNWVNEGIIGYASSVDGQFELPRKQKNSKEICLLKSRYKKKMRVIDSVKIDDNSDNIKAQRNGIHLQNNDMMQSSDDILISHSDNKETTDYELRDSVSVDDCDCNEVDVSTSLENDTLISNSPGNEPTSVLEDNLTLDQQLLLLTQLIDRHDSENPLDPENSQSFFVNPEDENHMIS